MSKEYTNSLRGIFSIMVVFHHLYQYSGLFRETYIGLILQLLGSLSVSMFFFFSGYGLMFSSKRQNYISNFWSKRFLPLYCFYVFLIFLYSIWTYLLEGEFSITHFIQSFFFGKTVVTNGWYMQTTFIVYLLYMFIFKCFKQVKSQFFIFSSSIFAYCIFCHMIGMDIHWYQTAPCVILGITYCYKKEFLDILLKKYAWRIFFLSSLLFAFFLMLAQKNFMPIVFGTLYHIFFVYSAIVGSYILEKTSLIHNNFFTKCGYYSLEIYVTHGLFLQLIKLKFITQMPIYVYILLVLIGTILMSVVVKKIHKLIASLLTKPHKKS